MSLPDGTWICGTCNSLVTTDTRCGCSSAVERGVADRMARALEHGPLALAALDVPALVSLVRDVKLRAALDGYDPRRDGGRLVLGPTGIGKTSAGAWIARRLTEAQLAAERAPKDYQERGAVYRKRLTIMFVRAADLPRAVLETGLGDGEPELIREAVKAGFLVLDDMGWESKRAGAGDTVEQVLARRYDHGRPTYVTTGKRLAEFVESYGEAVVRRICEAGGKPGKVVDCWREAKR